jgi:hypothetical protein
MPQEPVRGVLIQPTDHQAIRGKNHHRRRHLQHAGRHQSKVGRRHPSIGARQIQNTKSNKNEFVSRASAIAEEQLGNLPDQFDLVMFCMSPGTGSDWEAFANINRWDSHYSDEWCGAVSAQLNEIGCNLNLAHSGEGNRRNYQNVYEDKSGMMGSSFQNDDAPKRCFNGPKNCQLGWYSRQNRTIDPIYGEPAIMTEISKTRNFIMNGGVDYNIKGDTENKLVSLRLRQRGSELDYYIGYNRAFGFNMGTQEDAY